MKKKITGVYGIFDLDTDQCLYVGQSVDVKKRMRTHKGELVKGKHIRSDLQEWFDQEGNQAYFLILEECADTDDAKNSCEIKWFKLLRPLFYGLEPNMNTKWGMSESAKAKIVKSLLSRGENFTERNREICDLYEQGLSLREISERYDLSHIAIMRIVSRNGVEIRSNASKVTEDDVQKMVELYYAGLNNPEIAQEMGMAQSSVQRILSDNGINRVGDRVDRDREILKLHNDGMSNKDLAKKFGLAERSVRSILNKNGIKPRSHYTSPKDMEGLRSKVKELYLNNVSNSDIAQQLQLTPAQVKHAVHKSGAGAIRRKQIAEKHNRIVDLYSHGLTIKDIAGKVDMQYKSVWDILVKKGILKKD